MEMNVGGYAEALTRLLSRWSVLPPELPHSRVQLICHQPHRGPLAYFHRIYPYLSDEDIFEVEAIVGSKLPPKMRTLYTLMNGATLFEESLNIGGLVRGFSRDPGGEAPTCIEQHNLVFPAFRSEWRARGFFRVGGVSFVRQDELICGPDDRVILLNVTSGEPLREFRDVFDCLTTFASEMASFWTDDGRFTGNWSMLDQLLIAPEGSA